MRKIETCPVDFSLNYSHQVCRKETQGLIFIAPALLYNQKGVKNGWKTDL